MKDREWGSDDRGLKLRASADGGFPAVANGARALKDKLLLASLSKSTTSNRLSRV